MDKTEVYIKLDNNIRNLNSIENNISTIQYAIYRKSIQKIRDQKNAEIHKYFETQAEYYAQKPEGFKDDLNSIYEEYDFQMKRVIDVYDKMFVDVLKILKNACNNQKIAVSNIVTVDNQYNQDFLTPDKITDLKNLKMACAQKKVNYSVIVKECKARIKWVMDNAEKDLLEMFDNTNYIGVIGVPEDRAQIKKQIEMRTIKEDAKKKKKKQQDTTEITVSEPKNLSEQLHETSFDRFARFIRNLFHGSQKYSLVIKNFKAELFTTKDAVDKKIVDLATTLAGVTKQLEMAKKRINTIYEQASKNNSLV